MTSLASVYNESDPLEEIIVGVADNARIPSPDPSLYAIDYLDHLASPEQIPSGPYSNTVIDQANEDLDRFVRSLQAEGVIIRRPAVTDHSAKFSTSEWAAEGEYNYCARDVLLPIGDTMIESPMVHRTRYFEAFTYREILHSYMFSGCRWISAPKPRLPDEPYNTSSSQALAVNDLEPLFEAANVIRVGEDILYLVSSSGNELGLRWLRTILEPQHRVHAVRNVYVGNHLDTTITVVRPSLVVINPERARPNQVPIIFENWEILWSTPMVDSGFEGFHPRLHGGKA